MGRQCKTAARKNPRRAAWFQGPPRLFSKCAHSIYLAAMRAHFGTSRTVES
jgi:hypothetical protein